MCAIDTPDARTNVLTYFTNTYNHIQSLTITYNLIQSNTITYNHIQSHTVTYNHIVVRLYFISQLDCDT